MSRPPSYTDDELARAVRDSSSWRGVLRSLGLAATSASAIRSVRRQADRLDLDHRHFTGQRRWSDDALIAAIESASTWRDVVESLGLADDSSIVTLRGHAVRLGIDTDHLEPTAVETASPATLAPTLDHLPRAASLLAAGWFTLCGLDVSWPLEPCRYDLTVRFGDGFQRIQVKTTRRRTGNSWTVWLSTTKVQRRPYAPDEIDYFFVIDGDLAYYLIPVAQVAGLHAIQLSAYADLKVHAPS